MTKESDFNAWNTTKKKRNALTKPKEFREGDIWIASIGVNIGSEMNGRAAGRGGDFVRPVLVLRKYGKNTFIGIPLTTQSAEKITEYPDFFHNLGTERKNGFSCLALTQLRLFSANRLLRKETSVRKEELKRIRTLVMNVL